MTKRKFVFKTALSILSLIGASEIQAQPNNLWLGTTSSSTALDVSANWSLGTPTTTQIAEFTSSSPIGTALESDNGLSVQGFLFDAGAPSYSLDLNGSTQNFNIGTSGVVNNSSSIQTFELDTTQGGSFIFASIPNGVNSSGTNVNYTIYGLPVFGGSLVFQGPTEGTGIYTINDNATFVVGGNSSIGQLTTNSSSTIELNGSLTVNLDSDTAAQGAITGPGALIIDGPINPSLGIYLDLSGPLSYTGGTILNGGGLIADSPLPGSITINGGIFEIYSDSSAGSLSGVGGSINWISNATNLTIDQTSNGTYAGVLTGSVAGSTFTVGTIDSPTATGTLRLTGNSSSYTGNVVVNSGNLQVNGNLAANSVTVNGGTLSGTGTIGTTGNTVTIAAGGSLSPGNSVGTLTNAGNQVFLPGSFFQLEENGNLSGPGQSIDLLIVQGTAAVSGGTVNVFTTDGVLNFNTKQTFLTSAGLTVTNGGFVLNNPALPVPYNPELYSTALSFDTTNYYITTQTTFTTAVEAEGGNSTELAIAEQFDGIVDPTTVQNAFLNDLAQLSTGDFIDALDDLSGSQYTADSFIAEVSNRRFLRRLYDPIRQIVTTEPNDCDCYCDPCANSCGQFLGLDIWASAGGGQSQINGHNRLKLSEWDVTLGLQKTFCHDWTIGIAGSYEHNSLNYRSHNSGSGYTWFGGVYGLYRPSCFYVLADVTYGYTRHKLNRTVFLGTDVLDRFKSKPQFSQVTFYAEAGIDFNLCSFLIQPFVGIEVDSFHRNRHRESDLSGSGLGLSINRTCHTNAISSLGTHLTGHFGYGFDVSMDLAWLYRFNQNNHFRARFSEFETDYFTVHGRDFGRNSGEGAITLSNNFYDNWRFFVEASGEVWENASTYNFLGGVQFTW